MPVVAIVLATIAIGAAFVSERALNAFDRMLLPEFARDAEIIGRRIANEVERANRLGIETADLRGTEEFLLDYFEGHPALVYLGVLDAQGHSVGFVGDVDPQFVDLPEMGPDRDLHRSDDDQLRVTTLRLGSGAETTGYVQVGMDARFADRQIRDIRWDIVVVLVVSLLISFELLVFFVDRAILSPLQLIEHLVSQALAGNWLIRSQRPQRSDEVGAVLSGMDSIGRKVASRLARIDRKMATSERLPQSLVARANEARRRIRLVVEDPETRSMPTSAATTRLPLFLFVLAEEMSRSFMPLYAGTIYLPIADLPVIGPMLVETGLDFSISPAVASSLPIMVFMAAIAIATPLAGGWVTRYGARSIFLMGAVPAAVGYLGSGLAASTWDLLFWRCLSGVGYALITIACQDHLARAGNDRERTRNLAVFVAAITTAVICGTSIGGVLADRLGYRATFGISVVLVITATLIAAKYLQDSQGGRERLNTRSGASFAIVANPRFLALLVLIAIPAKIALTGFLFYASPVYLQMLDFTQPAIGRIIMLYGLAMLVGTHTGAMLASGYGRMNILVVVGGIGTAAMLFLPYYVAADWVMAVAIFGFGIAQGLAAAPMLAVLPVICPREAAHFGRTALVALLRLGERIGSVIGPPLVASLALAVGFVDAIAIVGAISGIGAILYFVASRMSAPPAHSMAEDKEP